ncbi:MAG TPA: metalloregulator ArsR/SmtB family transcription factor [Nocardioides sp.]|nr:metalloregulator ArsR/SmtB family transcription factor [Nocardioides sp.]
MNIERSRSVEHRVAVYAALADPTRLRVVDVLTAGDAASSELSVRLGIPSNLLAHHLRTLEGAGVIERRRSEGDGRRSYWRLAPDAIGSLGSLGSIAGPAPATPGRVVFVCTANTARSHLAAALWRAASDIPVTSAGTQPGPRIARGAVAAAGRHGLDLPEVAPRSLAEIGPEADDLVVTVCDLAHEELAGAGQLHWSTPDPVAVGTRAAFDRAHDELAARVRVLAPLLQRAS